MRIFDFERAIGLLRISHAEAFILEWGQGAEGLRLIATISVTHMVSIWNDYKR